MTPQVIDALSQSTSTLSVVTIKHSGSTVARNIGVNHAQGSIIFFGEGDAIYKSDYVENAVNMMLKDTQLGGVCLTGAPWMVKSSFITRSIDVENRIQRKMLEDGTRDVFYAWIFQRKAIEAVGIFDKKLFQAEDKDLFRRVKEAGYRIGLINGVNWRHKRDQNLWTFLKRNYYGGQTRILYLMKHRMYFHFIRAIGFLWFLLFCGLLGWFIPQAFWLFLIAIGSLLAYKLLYALRYGWYIVKKKQHLLYLPWFTLLRHTSHAIGTTHGFLRFLLRKMRLR
jgi:glycosyltransferase involved in cell wall biosynthesis